MPEQFYDGWFGAQLVVLYNHRFISGQ